MWALQWHSVSMNGHTEVEAKISMRCTSLISSYIHANMIYYFKTRTMTSLIQKEKPTEKNRNKQAKTSITPWKVFYKNQLCMHFSLWRLLWTKLVQSSIWKKKKYRICLFFLSFKTKFYFHFYLLNYNV